MKRNFMVVGAGFGQVPAIKSAQKLGLTVIAVDGNPNAVGMSLADIALTIDLLDAERIVSAATTYNVVGAMTMQSDIGVAAVGAVVDSLGLPGNGLDIALKCSNKILMRESLSKSGVSQPEYAVVNCLKDAKEQALKIGFPCIIKAPDNSGSRGVVKVSSLAEVSNGYLEARKYTNWPSILVEEYIDGIEVGAQAFSVEGSCKLVLMHDDYMSVPPFMVPVGHAFPSSLSHALREHAEKAVRACVDALGIGSGPSNIDLIIDHDGKAKIIEVGARIGATCLPELVFYHSKLDWVECAVLASIGEVPDLIINEKSTEAVVAFILQSPKDGVYKGYEFQDIKIIQQDEILEWEVTATPNESVHMLRKGTDRIGKVVMKGVDVVDALSRAKNFISNIKFSIL